MSSKFKVSIDAPLEWPNKCAVCGGYATTTYEAYGGAFRGLSFMIPEADIKTKELGISYPICLKHKYTTKMVRMLYFISFLAMFFSVFTALMLYKMESVVSSPALAIFLISVITFIASVKWQPVRLRLKNHFATLIIRNDQYAREFSALNSL